MPSKNVQAHRPPFQERKTPWRGILDIATGRYPVFLFGGGLDRHCLPVFHFHEAWPDALEPYFRYLAENRYQTVVSDALEAWVLRGIHPGQRSVVLCFDDAWNSFRSVVFPLLEKYNLQAITYVSPALVPEAPLFDDGDAPAPTADMDRRPPFFCSWRDLQELHASGRVDIQAHSLRHSKIPAAETAADFIRPGFRCHPHERPLLDTPQGQRFATADDLGAPLYSARSRLSDAYRWIAPDAFAACTDYVRENGGETFFDEPDWWDALQQRLADAPQGRWETPEERDAAILEDLAQSRGMLQSRLGKSIAHMCFPWAVAGTSAVRLAAQAGYTTACADRLGGKRTVHAGDPPFQLMRLKHQWIFALPGKGRRTVLFNKPASASTGLQLDDLPLPANEAGA